MLTDTIMTWLDTRGIDPTLAEKFGVRSKLLGQQEVLAVEYRERGQVINHKYRALSAKRFQMDPDAPLTLWNVDCLLDDSLASQPLIVTEGEWDALAILSSGKRRVVSVPNGAPAEPGDDQALAEGKRYSWFWRCEALLRDVGKVILCVDNDDPGRALASDLLRLFGPERCMFVTYPENCKDANDVKSLWGQDALIRMLDEAKPYPIKGLFRISDFPELGEMETIGHGIPGLSDLVQVVPSSLTVLTGYPGQGKTSLSMAIVGHLLRNNVPVCIGTFETLPKPILQSRLRATILRRQEHGLIPVSELQRADDVIERNLTIIAQMVDEDDELTLEEILERARVSVLRDGTKVVILDPWNEIEHKRRPDETETEYVSRALRMIKTFMRQNNVAVWIVAHPAKPHPSAGKKYVPGLSDISGSQNWANKADYGIVCTRPDKETNEAVVYVTKVRMGYPGREGKVRLAYDFRTSSYSHLPEMMAEAAE